MAITKGWGFAEYFAGVYALVDGAQGSGPLIVVEYVGFMLVSREEIQN